MERPETLKGEALGTLFSKLVDRARDTARAEVDYYRGLATRKAVAIVRPAALFVVALLFVQAALTVLLIAVGIGISTWLGFGWGMLAGAVSGLVIAGLLGAIGAQMLKGGS